MLRKKVKLLLEQLEVCVFAEIVFGVTCTSIFFSALKDVYGNTCRMEFSVVFLTSQILKPFQMLVYL